MEHFPMQVGFTASVNRLDYIRVQSLNQPDNCNPPASNRLLPAFTSIKSSFRSATILIGRLSDGVVLVGELLAK